MSQFLELNPQITLEQAVQELRQREEEKNNNFIQMSNEVLQTFEQHDAVHILFDCGTTIKDEIAAHIWMLFGTNTNLHQMHQAVAEQEHRNVLSNVGHFKLIGIWFISLPRILSIMVKCSRMKKRLAWEELEKLKKQSIGEIRQQHGIFV